MMQVDAPLSIRSIGDEVAYSDNAEGTILEILSRVSDPSDGSDELAAQINDWPTRYHFSPQRSNLLRPFKITPGMTILEIGAGTGALTRYLAEQGAEVTAVEGTRARALSVAERCRGMDQVEVVCGDFKNFESDQAFDLVLVVGVLEYAGSAAGGRSAPEPFLKRVVSCLGVGGILVLAIENQLGLKYLLGGKEDHLGKAWVGLEGYPGDHGIRTWGRRTLRVLLQEQGLPTQRWFYPFPDYKTPSAILSEETYTLPEAPTLIDQWASPPIIDHADPDRPIHDDRAVHGVFLDEGLGPEVSNSFLIAAAGPGRDLDRLIDPDILIHHFGGDRRQHRRRLTTLGRKNEVLWVHSHAVMPIDPTTGGGWLEFRPDRDQPFVEGPNLEQEILGACRRGSITEIEECLDQWWRHLEALEKSVHTAPDRIHPFLSALTTATLPSDYLDVQPSNFIRTPEGLSFIDREWVAAPAVDARMVRFRALWYLARTLIVSGTPLPWPEDTTVQSLVRIWMGRWTSIPDQPTFSALLQAEAALQCEASGGSKDTIEAALKIHGTLNRKDVLAGRSLGHTTSREEMVQDLQDAMEQAGHHQRSLENQVADQRNRAELAEQHLLSIEDVLDRAKAHNLKLETEITDQKIRANLAEHHFQAAQTTILGLNQEILRAADHIGNLETALSEAGEHILTLEKSLAEAGEYILTLEKSLAEAGEYGATLEKNLAEAGEYGATLEKNLTEAGEYGATLEKNLAEAGRHIEKLEVSLDTAQTTVASLQEIIGIRDSSITSLNHDLETTNITLTQVRARLEEAEAWRRAYERRPLVRLYRRLRWWLPQ